MNVKNDLGSFLHRKFIYEENPIIIHVLFYYYKQNPHKHTHICMNIRYHIPGAQLNKFQIISIAALKQISFLCVCAFWTEHTSSIVCLPEFCGLIQNPVNFCMATDSTLIQHSYLHKHAHIFSNRNKKYINKQFIVDIFVPLLEFQANIYTMSIAAVDCVKFCGKF